MHFVTAAPVDGRPSDDILMRIRTDLKSPHQFRALDAMHIIFVGSNYALQLDRVAMETLAETLRETGSGFAHLVGQIAATLKIKPQLDPEVKAVIARKTMSTPPPKPKPWRARIRFKDAYGQTEEVNEPLADMAELADIINRCDDFSFVRNIKIKLERVL